MTPTEKSEKIKAIVNHMKLKIHQENKELCKQNRHNEQEPFDEGDAALALAFRSDEEINKAYAMIIR